MVLDRGDTSEDGLGWGDFFERMVWAGQKVMIRRLMRGVLFHKGDDDAGGCLGDGLK